MNAEVDKLDINKLPDVPTDLNNKKTKVDDLDVGKLKTVPTDSKKLVSKDIFKGTKLNKLNIKVNDFGKKSWWVYFNSVKSIQHK